MVFLPTIFCMSTLTAQDVITINCRDAVSQSTPKELLFFTYVLAPKLSGIYVQVLSSDDVATTSEVRTAQGPLLASVRIKFKLRPVTLLQWYFFRGRWWTRGMYVYRFQNVFLRCPTPRLHCFLSSHWPSFRFLSCLAFFIPSIQFFFCLPRVLLCFVIRFIVMNWRFPFKIWTTGQKYNLGEGETYFTQL